MDIQRTGLLGILGILTYVLFLQWNIFTEAQNSTAESVRQPKNKSLSTSEIPPRQKTLHLLHLLQPLASIIYCIY